MKKIFVFFLISLMIACSEDIRPTLFTYSKLITGNNSKTWKLDKFATRVKGKNDAFESLGTCVNDDRYIFYANSEKLFEVNNGNIKCTDDDTDPILVSYVWEFNNANASLSMVVPHVFGYYFIPFTVKKLTNTEMELEIFINQEATVSYVLFFVKVGES